MDTLLKTCVELSTDYQINFQKNHSPESYDLFDGVLSTFMSLEWKLLFGGKILYLPIVLLLFGLCFMVALLFYPFFKVSDWIERKKNIKQIKVTASNFNEYMTIEGATHPPLFKVLIFNPDNLRI